MTREPETVELYGDVGPLILRLQEHGGNLAHIYWTTVAESTTIELFLPDDDDQAEACRQIIADWQATHPAP